MHAKILLTTILATLPFTTCAPTKRSTAVYHGIGLTFITSIPSQPRIQSPAPVEINVLVTTTGATASTIAFDEGVSPNVDNHKVECRAFKDADGIVPLAEPFNYKTQLVLSTTELVDVGSVLCYVVTDAEAGEF